MSKNYVVGFAFDTDLSNIVLIEKKRPPHLAGFLNGVGGEIKPDESSFRAMCREFAEETGVVTEPHEWYNLGPRKVNEDDYLTVLCMADDKVLKARTMTDEKVIIMGNNLHDITNAGTADLQELVLYALTRLVPDYWNRKMDR